MYLYFNILVLVKQERERESWTLEDQEKYTSDNEQMMLCWVLSLFYYQIFSFWLLMLQNGRNIGDY